MFIILDEDFVYDIVDTKEEVADCACFISDEVDLIRIEEWRPFAGGWKRIHYYEGYVHDGVFGWCN